MADIHERELEMELEDEFHEGELEMEDEAGLEGEGWLSAIGNIAGSLLGEEELEDENELELEDELEDESESWLKTGSNMAGSFYGETEDELEDESEDEDETEQFSFGGIGKFLKKAAKVAAPLVGTAILGPMGGQLLGKATGALLGEAELEDETEDEDESESEMAHEIASHPLSQNEALAEMLAEAAAYAANESEAEAMAGAAFATIISPSDRRALSRVMHNMVRGAAVLTRILRRQRRSRHAVRAVPAIMRRAVKDLKRQAAKGSPITRRRAARTVAKHVRRVLGSPKAASAAIKRNVKVTRMSKRRLMPRRSYGGQRRRRISGIR